MELDKQISSIRELIDNQKFEEAESELKALNNVSFKDPRIKFFEKIISDSRSFYLKRSFKTKIKIILETIPRSGTHYTIDSIQKHCSFGYASIFLNEVESSYFEKGVISRGKLYFQLPLREQYLVKTHFFNRLEKTDEILKEILSDDLFFIQLICYPYDCIYSWCHLVYFYAGGREQQYSNYIVKANSQEWRKIKTQLPKLKSWFQQMSNKNIIRYEDYNTTSTSNSIKSLASFLNTSPEILFQGFKPNEKRSYYNGNIKDKFEPSVLNVLADYLGYAVGKYYPEREIVF